MNGGAPALRRLESTIWALIAALTATVLGAVALSDFRFVWHSLLAPGGVAVLLLCGQWFYGTRRPDPQIASAMGGTAQLIIFAAFGAPLSYLGASLALPLQDRILDATDRALGLDWPAMLAWMDAHAALHPAFRGIYLSLMPQTIVVVLVLAFTARLVWLRVFTLSFFLAAVITIAIAALLPAEGVWGYHGLAVSDNPNIMPATRDLHLPIFRGLRDGSFRWLMASGSEGIITFPSLHAALAVIMTAGLWPMRGLRWLGLAFNVTMLVSIPLDGGHYFTDMLAGGATAWLSLSIARAIAAGAAQPRVPALVDGSHLEPGE